MKNRYRVIITPKAERSLAVINEYIEKQSPTAAKYVRTRLIRKAKSLSTMPERFSKEEYLSGKEGNYRSVSLWQYKIIYLIQHNEVLILRFVHTSRDPERLKKL